MSEYPFIVFWSKADNLYIAACPDVPGVSGLGKTRALALSDGELSLKLAAEVYQHEGWTLPTARETIVLLPN